MVCVVGTDGKPQRKLAQDAKESENEAYSGFSAYEESNYDIWDGFGDEPGWLGRLLGPINDRYGIAGIWVHQHCAVWSPEVCSLYPLLILCVLFHVIITIFQRSCCYLLHLESKTIKMQCRTDLLGCGLVGMNVYTSFKHICFCFFLKILIHIL